MNVPMSRYPIPAQTCRVEEEIVRSRFITTLAHTPTEADARAVIGAVRTEFHNASHHCWAYLIGPPGTTGRVGMSDDGEPHGTAGRPMLTVLIHSGLGDVTAVVTRYFGGTKLGKGGLVRAYSKGVQQALENAVRTERVVRVLLNAVVDYAHLASFKRLLPDFETEVESEVFGADVALVVSVPDGRVEAFQTAVKNLTGGRGKVERNAQCPSG